MHIDTLSNATDITRTPEDEALDARAKAKIARPQIVTGAREGDVADIADIAELDAKLAEAEASHLALEQGAAAALRAAEKAQATFTHEPTAKAHADAAVAQQRAVNAQRLADDFRARELDQLRAAKHRALEDIEREQLRRDLDWAHVQQPLDRIHAAIANLVNVLDAETAEVVAQLKVRHGLTPRAAQLGIAVGTVKLERLLYEVGEKITTAYGPKNGAENHLKRSSFILGGQNHDTTFRVELMRPVSCPEFLK